MGSALMTSTIDGCCCCGEVLRISASSCERIAEARMRHIVYSRILTSTHGNSALCVLGRRDVVRQADRLLPRERSHRKAE